MRTPSVIAKNIFSLTAMKGVTSLFPLIVVPYLISTIGIEKYGVVIFALSFVAYFNTLIDYSFKVTAVREISRIQNDKKAIDEIVSNVISTKVCFLLLSLVLGSALIFITPIFKDEMIVFLLILSSVIGYALLPNWFFMGVEKMEYIALFTVIFKTLHVLAIFIAVKSFSDYWIYALIITLESGLIALAGLILMRYKFKVKFKFSSFGQIKKQVYKNSGLFLNQFVPNLYNNTTTLLLGFFGGASITGAYGVLRKITNVAESIIGIISNAFFPAINRSSKNAKQFRKIQWITTTALCIALIAGSAILLDIFKVNGGETFWALIILTLGIIGLTMYEVYGLNYFIINKEDRLVYINTLLFSILGFLLAFPVIYWGGIIGAASIVTFTRIFIGGRLFWKFQFS